MALWRLVWRPDARLVVGALGMAAAFLLPMAATFALAGLEVRVDHEAWVAYRPDGGTLEDAFIDGARLAVAHGQLPATTGDDPLQVPVAAYVRGPAGVDPGQAVAPPGSRLQPPAGLTLLPSERPLDLVAGRTLVHPSLVSGGAVAALFDQQPVQTPAGVVVAPARGADAFERAGAEDLRDSTGLLMGVSLPGAALMAWVFVRAEVHERRRTAATLVALGSSRSAMRVLVGRSLVLVALGAGLAVAALALLALGDVGPFAAAPPPERLALVLVVPMAAAVGACVATAALAVGNGARLLRGGGVAEEGARVPFLPILARPLVLGPALLPVLLVAAALFAVDVGTPVAIASVPASLAGGDDEWVVGSEEGLSIGSWVPAQPASVLGHSEAVSAAVAEILVPTLVAGHPVVLRGAPWEALSRFHGLDGDPPGAGIVLGDALAKRSGAGVGDTIAVQAAHRPAVHWLRVEAIAEGRGLMSDEAFVTMEVAAGLTGAPPGMASLVRVRPQTDAALAAMQQVDPVIEVLGVRIEPDPPVAGGPMEVVVDLVNLGRSAGVRTLTAHVDGRSVGSVDAHVAGLSTSRVRIFAVAPGHAFLVDVNPTVEARPEPSPHRLVVPPIGFAGQPFTARIQAAGAGVSDEGDGEGETGEGQAGGDTVAGVSVELRDPSMQVATATTDQEGVAVFTPPAPGQYWLYAATGEAASLRVGRPEDGQQAALRVEALWTVPPRVRPGEVVQVHATVGNWGGQAGNWTADLRVDGLRLGTVMVEVDPGQAEQVVANVPWPASGEVRLGNHSVQPATVRPGGSAPSPAGPAVPRPVSGEAAQVQVAERVLGDARTTLVGLAGVSLATVLALVYMATSRVLRGRSHVIGILEAVGADPARIRFRAATEAAVLGTLAFTAVAPLVKVGFHLASRWQWPIAYGHRLPDPMTAGFFVQACLAFAAACALAAYLGAGPALERSPLRPAARRLEEPLDPVPLGGRP